MASFFFMSHPGYYDGSTVGRDHDGVPAFSDTNEGFTQPFGQHMTRTIGTVATLTHRMLAPMAADRRDKDGEEPG